MSNNGDLDSRLTALEGRVALLENRNSGEFNAAADAILDSQYGDPIVKKDPPRWDGPSYVGKRFSECTVEYLESLAGFKKWCYMQSSSKGDDRGAKYAKWDVEKALGWMERLTNGHKNNSDIPEFPD